MTPRDRFGAAIRSRAWLSVLPIMVLVLAWLSGSAYAGVGVKPQGPPPGADPHPQAAAQAILTAFDRYEFVAMPHGHGNKDIDDFILGLLRNPAFPSKVNDIVLEGGNSLYQPLLDRYTAGEDVPMTELRHVWRDSTQPSIGENAMYSQVVALVRQINAELPKGKKLRVVAPDPPVDWSQIKTAADFAKFFGERGSSEAEIVKNEVLARRRKALLLFGSAHILRPGLIVSTIEKERPGAVFIITNYTGFYSGTPRAKENNALESRISSWPVPSLVRVKETWLGNLDQDALVRPPAFFGGCGMKPPESAKLVQVVDAVLYLGPRDLLLRQPRPAYVFADKEYLAELKRRASLQSGGMRVVGDSNGIDPNSPEAMAKFDQDPLLYDPAVEENYARLLAAKNEEAKKHCPSGASESRQIAPQAPLPQSTSPDAGGAHLAPSDQVTPSGWSPPSDLAPGATFHRQVPSGAGANGASAPAQGRDVPQDQPDSSPK